MDTGSWALCPTLRLTPVPTLTLPPLSASPGRTWRCASRGSTSASRPWRKREMPRKAVPRETPRARGTQPGSDWRIWNENPYVISSSGPSAASWFEPRASANGSRWWIINPDIVIRSKPPAQRATAGAGVYYKPKWQTLMSLINSLLSKGASVDNGRTSAVLRALGGNM